MNVYDSSKMVDILYPFGYSLSDNLEDADMVILNTCHIREKAAEKVYSELGRIKNFKDIRKKNGKEMIITVAGCVGQAEGEEVFARAPFVDIVVGPQSYHNLPELLEKISRNNGRAMELNFLALEKFDKLPEESLPQGYSAFLTIQEGCDKFCKFCCVPYTRGAEISRPVSDIYREAIRIISQGSLEITLLGQNVSSYYGLAINDEKYNLPKLLRHLSTIDGIKRLRYTTSHPKDMNDDLIDAHVNIKNLMPHLHLPVQSGSDKILKTMNRQHDAQYYLDFIKKIRKSKPDMAFSSDFIVGYPGETEEDFQATLDLISEVGYAQSYSFKYSTRPGTPASVMTNQIDEDIKSDRLLRLQTLLNLQQLNFNKSKIGCQMYILLEKIGKYDGQLVGKSPYYQSVYVDAPKELIGKIVKVKINKATQNSMGGVLQ